MADMLYCPAVLCTEVSEEKIKTVFMRKKTDMA